MAEPVIVLKFGSSVIPTESALGGVVQEIARWRSEGWRVVAVVSAIGGATDALLAHAKAYGGESEGTALAAYVATGELQAVALLGLALGWAGVRASVADAATIGLRTIGPALDATPVALHRSAVDAALERAPVLVVPGFLGRSEHDETTLLGRGGSDLTAVFIAEQLGARCRLVKDVDGLYERDPAQRAPGELAPRRFRAIRFDDALGLDGGIVQHKAVRFARERGVSFEVGAAGREGATVVGSERTEVEQQTREAPAAASWGERGAETGAPLELVRR